jgi:hypothetical protein
LAKLLIGIVVASAAVMLVAALLLLLFVSDWIKVAFRFIAFATLLLLYSCIAAVVAGKDNSINNNNISLYFTLLSFVKS